MSSHAHGVDWRREASRFAFSLILAVLAVLFGLGAESARAVGGLGETTTELGAPIPAANSSVGAAMSDATGSEPTPQVAPTHAPIPQPVPQMDTGSAPPVLETAGEVAQPIMDTAAETVRSPVQPTVETATDTAQPLLETATERAQPVVQKVTETAQPVQPVVERVTERAQPVLETATEIAQPVLETATEISQPVLERATETAQPAVEAATRPAQPVVRTVRQTAQPVLAAASAPAQPVVQPLVQTAEPVLKAAAPAVQTAVQVVRTVRQTAQPVLEVATPPAQPLVQAVVQTAEPVLAVAAQGVQPAVLPVPGAATHVAPPVVPAAAEAFHGTAHATTPAARPEHRIQTTNTVRRPVVRPVHGITRQSPDGNERLAAAARPAEAPVSVSPTVEPADAASPHTVEIDPRATATFRTTFERAADRFTVVTDAVRRATSRVADALHKVLDLPKIEIASAGRRSAAGVSEASAAVGYERGSTDAPARFPVLTSGSAGSPATTQPEMFAALGRASPPAAREPGSRLPLPPDLLRLYLLAVPLERPG